MLFGPEWLLLHATLLVPLAMSLAVHEWAHAWTACQLGDDTAQRLGRLTLNPLAHVDPVGTILLPVVIGLPFGWAKPVPINPSRFVRTVTLRAGLVLTAAAGPLANACIALICVGLVAILAAIDPKLVAEGVRLRVLLEWMVTLNVLLAVFNALPIPPLDGSRVVDALIPDRARALWDRFETVAPFAIAGVLVLPLLFGGSLLAWPVEQAQHLIAQFAPGDAPSGGGAWAGSPMAPHGGSVPRVTP